MDGKEVLSKLAEGPEKPAGKPAEKEKSAVPFDYGDIHNGHVRQVVTISPKLSVVYQSLNGTEDQWLKEQLSGKIGKAPDYVSTWYRNMEAALGVISVTLMGRQLDLPTIDRTLPQGALYPIPALESVEKRAAALLGGTPHPVLVQVLRHYDGFLDRVSKDLAEDSLKNG